MLFIFVDPFQVLGYFSMSSPLIIDFYRYGVFIPSTERALTFSESEGFTPPGKNPGHAIIKRLIHFPSVKVVKFEFCLFI